LWANVNKKDVEKVIEVCEVSEVCEVGCILRKISSLFFVCGLWFVVCGWNELIIGANSGKWCQPLQHFSGLKIFNPSIHPNL